MTPAQHAELKRLVPQVKAFIRSVTDDGMGVLALLAAAGTLGAEVIAASEMPEIDRQSILKALDVVQTAIAGFLPVPTNEDGTPRPVVHGVTTVM